MTRILGVIGFALLLMGAGPYQDPYYQGKYGPFPTYEGPRQEKRSIPPALLWDLYTVMQADRQPRPAINFPPTIYPQFDLRQLFPRPDPYPPWYLRPYPQSQVVTPSPAPRPLGICTHVGHHILCN